MGRDVGSTPTGCTKFLMNERLVLPCICGHLLTAHGEVTEVEGRWEWDMEGEKEEWVESPYPRPVCWECGPGDCSFVEMTNLEFLEWKCEINDKD